VARAAWRKLWTDGYTDDIVALFAEAPSELGDVLRALGRHTEAVDQVEQGLAMFDCLDDRRIYAQVLNSLQDADWQNEETGVSHCAI
jgi:hypothetical protein